jgi:hypothetical protein
MLPRAEQERDGGEQAQAAEQAGHDVGRAQASGVRDEPAGQRAQRHQAPAEQDGDDAQQAVLVQPAQPFGDLGADGDLRLAGLPRGPGQPRTAMFAIRKMTTAACTAWARHMSVARS